VDPDRYTAGVKNAIRDAIDALSVDELLTLPTVSADVEEKYQSEERAAKQKLRFLPEKLLPKKPCNTRQHLLEVNKPFIKQHLYYVVKDELLNSMSQDHCNFDWIADEYEKVRRDPSAKSKLTAAAYKAILDEKNLPTPQEAEQARRVALLEEFFPDSSKSSHSRDQVTR